MSRPFTVEEMRERFLDQIRVLVTYWAGVENGASTKERLDGLAFSILNILDGTSELPAFSLIPQPHPDDSEYCTANEEDYWVETSINDDVHLHDLWYGKEPQR